MMHGPMCIICVVGSAVFTKYYSNGQIKKNEMGRACGTYGREER